MTSHPPPVPPDQRGPKGPGKTGPARPDLGRKPDQAGAHDPKAREQGRQGNLHQNTTNQGLQQDR
jgi:hypothetical protein